MTIAPETDLRVDEIDLSSFDFWLLPEEEREAAFRKLRHERPVAFFAEPEIEAIPHGPGYWSLTRYTDVMQASRNPGSFISGEGTNIPDFPEVFRDVFGSMINMDAPRHTKLRLIVNRGFTPRMVARIEQRVHEIAREILDEVAPKGECDFVTEVAAALPLRIICDMMGIPPSEYRWVFDNTNRVLGATDPEYGETILTALQAGMELYQYAQDLGSERLANPREDITTALMQAEVDGERLTAQELGSFFVLLVVAGNETTRNAISHGLKVLTDHPDQRQAWIDDFDGLATTAVEEIVRWATPVIHFRRTWPALLPRRTPRAARDQGDVRGAVPAPARHRGVGRTRPAALVVHPRHQTHARPVLALDIASRGEASCSSQRQREGCGRVGGPTPASPWSRSRPSCTRLASRAFSA